MLKSLEGAEYPVGKIPLIFKTHEGVAAEVWSFVNNYEWLKGPKHCVKDPEALGLDKNLLSCGDFTEQFEAVIVLEDDTVVSPQFYTYTLTAINQQGSQDRLGQISLYRYHYHPILGIPHHLIDDPFDGFYLQKTSTRGQVFTKQQWSGFKSWLKALPNTDSRLPDYIKKYGPSNWEYLHNWYLIHQNLYTLYPKLSLASNQGPMGTHHSNSIDSGFFQVPIRLRQTKYQLPSFEESQLCYDAFFEWLPEKFISSSDGALSPDQFDMDLYGCKPMECLQKEMMYTVKTSNSPIKQFGDGLKPIEINLITDNKGRDISLAKKESIVKKTKTDLYRRAKQYFGNNSDVGLWNFIRYKWFKYVERKH